MKHVNHAPTKNRLTTLFETPFENIYKHLVSKLPEQTLQFKILFKPDYPMTWMARMLSLNCRIPLPTFQLSYLTAVLMPAESPKKRVSKSNSFSISDGNSLASESKSFSLREDSATYQESESNHLHTILEEKDREIADLRAKLHKVTSSRHTERITQTILSQPLVTRKMMSARSVNVSPQGSPVRAIHRQEVNLDTT